MKKLRSVSLVSIVVVMLIFLTACFNPDLKDNASTKASSNKSKKLIVWDSQTDVDGGKLYQSFADGYAKEKGITVTRVVMKTEDLRNTVKIAINAGQGPDVFSYDPGAGYLGVLAKAGLAYNLTNYAKEHDWNNKFMPWTLKQCTFGGKLYGIGNQVEALGVFYNKQIFKANGIQIPKTYNDFLEVCKLLKSKGITPLLFDDLDQWPGFHLESMWLNSGVGSKAVSDVLELKTKFDQPSFGDALDRLSALVKDGYTNDSPNSMGYDDASKQFDAGKVAMSPTGTWQVSTYEDAKTGLGENCGFFFLPPNDGVTASGPNGIGESLVVNAKSSNIDLATGYLDYIFSGSQIQQWYDSSYIPSVKGVDTSGFKLSPLFKDVVTEILSAKESGYNLDVLLPAKVNDVTENDIQALLAGKKTGIQCMQDKQNALQTETAAGNYEAISK